MQYNGVDGCLRFDCKGIPYIRTGRAVAFSRHRSRVSEVG